MFGLVVVGVADAVGGEADASDNDGVSVLFVRKLVWELEKDGLPVHPEHHVEVPVLLDEMLLVVVKLLLELLPEVERDRVEDMVTLAVLTL
jgi:hypothetical protein